MTMVLIADHESSGHDPIMQLHSNTLICLLHIFIKSLLLINFILNVRAQCSWRDIHGIGRVLRRRRRRRRRRDAVSVWTP